MKPARVKTMASFVRMARIGYIWLTALMTLVAGMPHFSCRCPDGHVKPLCTGTVSAASGCCCSGACCSSSKGGTSCCRAQNRVGANQLQARSCCKHQDRQTNGSPGKQQVFGARGCTRTLAPSGVFAFSYGKTIVSKDLIAGAFLPPQAVAVVYLPTMAGGTPSWQSHQIAPPTNLVTTLQRFLI
jgi:hypothetical protein